MTKLKCGFCGDTTDECGSFYESPSGEVRHLGACCEQLAADIAEPFDSAQYKYATPA